MRTFLFFLTAMAALAAPVDERETIRKTFQTSAAGREVVVDNVNGFIRVTAHDGGEVRAVIERRLTAESEEIGATARSEVRLDVSQQANTVRFYVDGPFRHGGDRGRRHQQYEMRYDFVLEVPRDATLRLKTVNRGDVEVTGAAGEFDIHHVNGGIRLDGISGSGSARTINGKIRASFRRNPRAACSFSSINGLIEAAFQPDLAADLFFKTLNGGVYTDFPATYLPRVVPVAGRSNGKFVYRSNRSFGVRVGKGGPELRFDTLNGDIQITGKGQ